MVLVVHACESKVTIRDKCNKVCLPSYYGCMNHCWTPKKSFDLGKTEVCEQWYKKCTARCKRLWAKVNRSLILSVGGRKS